MHKVWWIGSNNDLDQVGLWICYDHTFWKFCWRRPIYRLVWKSILYLLLSSVNLFENDLDYDEEDEYDDFFIVSSNNDDNGDYKNFYNESEVSQSNILHLEIFYSKNQSYSPYSNSIYS